MDKNAEVNNDSVLAFVVTNDTVQIQFGAKHGKVRLLKYC